MITGVLPHFLPQANPGVIIKSIVRPRNPLPGTGA